MTTLQNAANKDPRDIILRPVVSEKSYGLIDEGKYTFLVDPRATKTAVSFLTNVVSSKNVLVVIERNDDVTLKSIRNLSNLHVLTFDQLNAYDVLVSDDIVFTQAALEGFIASKSGANQEVSA